MFRGNRPEEAQIPRPACGGVGFDKFHNAAFASPLPDDTVKFLMPAAKINGLVKSQTLLDRVVSCGAHMLVAVKRPLNMITGGAGSLERAHSDNERLRLLNLFKFIECLAYFLVTSNGGSTP